MNYIIDLFGKELRFSNLNKICFGYFTDCKTYK